MNVNACVILRRNNFDPLLIFSPRMTTYRVLRSVSTATKANQRCPPPATGASPPGHPVVDGWRRDERTRGIPQSHLRALVSPVASTRSLQVPTEQGRSTPGASWVAAAHRQHCCARVRAPQRRCGVRQLTFDPLLSKPAPLRGGLSCDNWDP
jgi:hypothetical protein